MRAYVTAPGLPGHIQEADIPEPSPELGQTLVRVTHFSINRGELGFASEGEPGRQIGWDIAGVVQKAAANGQGPAEGSRVVAFSRAQQGWAELVAIPSEDLAAVPDNVDLLEAVTLPVAGLTALYGLERGERLLGSRVLVTGATGGVGNFAVTLGNLMGAEVVAQVRREEQVEAIKSLGATQVVVDSSGEKLEEFGPYRLIFDGLGNDLTTRVLRALGPDGRAILYGVTAGNELAVSPLLMLGSGFGRVEGFNLYRESELESVARGLTRLLSLLSQDKVESKPSRVGTWGEAPQLSQSLLDREFGGKAVVELA